MKKTIGEIFKEIEVSGDAVGVLRKNMHKIVMEFCRLSLDPRVKWLIDPDKLEYRRLNRTVPDGQGDSNLWAESRRFYLFVAGRDIEQKKREMIWLNMAESLDSTEFELIKNMAKQTVPGLTYDAVESVYPGLLPLTKTKYVVEMGNIPKEKAEQFASDIISKYKDKVVSVDDMLNKLDEMKLDVVIETQDLPKQLKRRGRPKMTEEQKQLAKKKKAAKKKA